MTSASAKAPGSTRKPAAATARPPRVRKPRPKPPTRHITATLDRAVLLESGIFGFEYMDERAQPFNLLRSQLLRKLAPTGGRVIAISSTQPQNGKSFVAANLAAALSLIQPTILVDLDLRRPTVARRFGLPECAGVDDFLRGKLQVADILCKVAGRDLAIVPVRVPLENSADLLASARADALFEGLRNAPGSPVCIIDTPPILEGDDMLIIAKHVDGVLLVIEEGQTSQHELREALRILLPTPLLGTILNRSISRTVSSSYYRYSGYRRGPEAVFETLESERAD
jgi:protein-tyrosine kinase